MEILLSTSNQKKVNFIKIATQGLDIVFRTPKELGLKLNVEENGTTAVENAIIKAKALSNLSGIPTFAWDMGMRIEKLPEKLQPNLHIRRPYGNQELSDSEMVEYWRSLIEQHCENGESLAHYFDGVALVIGDKVIDSKSFDEDVFIFTARKKQDGVIKYNAFDQVRKTLDGKYFCELSDQENLKYDEKRAKYIRSFFVACLEKNNSISGKEAGSGYGK